MMLKVKHTGTETREFFLRRAHLFEPGEVKTFSDEYGQQLVDKYKGDGLVKDGHTDEEGARKLQESQDEKKAKAEAARLKRIEDAKNKKLADQSNKRGR